MGRPLVLVLALAALVRVVAALGLPEVRFPDSRTYEALARSLAEGGALRETSGDRARVAPLYPAVLAAGRAVLGPGPLAYRLPQLALGMATVAGVALLAAALWGRSAGLAAGVLAALDPFAVYFESLQLTEGPALALVTWTAWASWRARGDATAAVAAGVLTAAGALTRPALAVHGLALLGAALMLPGPGGPGARRAAGHLALALVAFVLVSVPWWERNHRVLGAFVPLTTDGGSSLYEGNSPRATGAPAIPETSARRSAELGLGEVERDRALRREALGWIAAHPGVFLGLAMVKLTRTWSPVPNHGPYRGWGYALPSLAACLVVLGLSVLGLVVAARRHAGWVAAWCLVPALVVCLTHCVWVGSVRYRMPAWPLLEVLAGAGMAAVAGASVPRDHHPP
ncbi:MAG: glycosyltransferase family 39 protein [Planctomycetes bacterium]|nr:glycosyltransferase family 39 protein [Planctomycetota bacterium]